MKSILLSTWALFVGVAFTMLSNGLQGPLLVLRAFDEGFDISDTGLVMAGYFVGYLAGALTTQRMIRQVGHAKVFAAFASIMSGTALLFATFVDPLVWFGLRVVTGLCFAGIVIVTEAWLNQKSPNEVRGKIMNLYIMLSFLAYGIGALLLNLSDPSGFTLFILASVLISFGIVPILLSAQPTPAFQAPKRLGILVLFRKAPLGVGAVFICGLAEGALLGAGPIFADQSGLTTAETSIFMAVIFLGSLIFMWPIGILSDRYNRPKVMITIAVLAALAAFASAATPVDLEILLFALVGLFSGLCLAIYGICSALINESLEPDEMIAGGTTLFVVYSVGMMLGPVISTEMIEAWQPSAFFLYHAAVQVLIVVYAIAISARRDVVSAPKRRPMGSLAHRHNYLATPSWMEGSPKPEQTER